MHRKNGQEAFRPVMTMVAVVFAIAVGLVGAQATAEAAASGQVVSVRGVVVHRAPLLDRYSIIGPRGHLLPIVTDGALPPLGHGVLVSIRKTGAEFQQVSLVSVRESDFGGCCSTRSATATSRSRLTRPRSS
jgi:hypothetical protein